MEQIIQTKFKTIKTYLNLSQIKTGFVKTHILPFKHLSRPHPKKLTWKKCWAWNKPKASDHIIISNVHKEGAFVIQDIKHCIQETEQQLDNNEYYREITHNPAKAHKLNNWLDRSKRQRLLKEKVTDGLKVENHITSEFYISPKIQKQGNLSSH